MTPRASTSSVSAKHQRIQRDNTISIVMGPMRLAVPILAALVIYPLILVRSGIEVVGLWSVLSSGLALLYLIDIGFSQLIAREASDAEKSHLGQISLDLYTAATLYTLALTFCAVCVYSFGEYITSGYADVYDPAALKNCLLTLFLGVYLTLIAKLSASVLMANQRNYFVQIVNTLVPLLTHSSMVVGAYFSMPIEGLAVGSVLTGLVTISMFFYGSSKWCPGSLSVRPSCKKNWK